MKVLFLLLANLAAFDGFLANGALIDAVAREIRSERHQMETKIKRYANSLTPF
jgi:hypothetical protein